MPQGLDYQFGEQYGSWNVREYILARDNYTCQHCKGKSKDKVLNTHHIESRKTGGNAPNNLITLCSKCHKDYHEGKIKLKIDRKKSLRDCAYMNIMKWRLVNSLKEDYSDIPVSYTYGFITKAIRIENELPKFHNIDALCIAQHPKATQPSYYFHKKKVRNHNRQIHRLTINKGGTRKLNQAPFLVKGFRLFDKVKYEDNICFISGRRSSGYFALKDIKWNTITNSITYKNLKLIEPKKSTLTSTIKKEIFS